MAEISKKPTRLDIAFIAAAVIIAVLLILPRFFGEKENTELYVISEAGEQVCSLAEDRTLELTSRGIEVKIRIEGGGAYIESSECPNGICMNSPAAKRTGDSIVCAPAGLALLIKDSGGGADADAIAG